MATGAGRISFLIDSPLRDLAHAMRELDGNVKKQIGAHTKAAAQPIWEDELRDRPVTRLQARLLADTGKVGVTAQNVFLRAGHVGKLSSGTPVQLLARAGEFGSNPSRQIGSKSRRGKPYTRTLGATFGAQARGGNVVHPAARDSIPRFAALWVQTAIRCIHESLEEVT